MINFPNYTQFDQKDCGPVCLKIIAKYYGKDYSIQFLRENSFLTREGVSMLGIADAAKTIGLESTGVSMNFNELKSLINRPCILHWNQEHFVVCYRIKANKKRSIIYISDPVGEKYKLDEKSFLKCWLGDGNKGYALLIEPTTLFYKREVPNKIKSKAFEKILHNLKNYKKKGMLLILALIIGGLFSFILPFLTQVIVDKGIKNKDLNFVTIILIVQLIIFSTQLACEFLRNRISLKINTHISISLISDFLSKIMKLPLRFFDTKNIGDLIQRIGDNERIRTFLTGSSLMTLYSIITFIAFSVVLATYNLNILVVFLIGNLLYVIWVLFFMKHRRKLDLIRFTQSASERSNLIQIITAMHEIKLNNSEEHQLKRWKEIQLNLFDINEKSLILGQYQQLGTIFFSQTTTLIISFISARAVIHGSMTLGMMMAISYIIGVLASPISQIINFIQMTQDASISLERLDEIYNIDDEEQAISSQKDYHCQNESLFLKNVDFSYDGSSRNLTLNGVNIKIPNNKVTAIVGASGSGKTTIMKLLLGFYKPLKGEILIGKELLDNINPYQWRKSLGAVMQDGYIFSDTITNNIILSGAFDEEKFNKAINIANIKEYIDLLPLKANTKIGLEGVGISLGQKQRLLIARAVYKNPDYLFFDEATNSLDTKNERTIMDNLNEFYKGRTVVIVAHRLSTVQSADKIIVIDKGKVIEEGTHTELIQKQRAYFSLVRDQLELNKSLY